MLKNIDLTREVPKAEYKRLKADADLKLAALQRQSKALGIPIIVVFEGWSAAGKGTLINEMILPLDPRGFSVYSTRDPTEEDTLLPLFVAILEANTNPWPVSHFRPELEPAGGCRQGHGADERGTVASGLR